MREVWEGWGCTSLQPLTLTVFRVLSSGARGIDLLLRRPRLLRTMVGRRLAQPPSFLVMGVDALGVKLCSDV